MSQVTFEFLNEKDQKEFLEKIKKENLEIKGLMKTKKEVLEKYNPLKKKFISKEQKELHKKIFKQERKEILNQKIKEFFFLNNFFNFFFLGYKFKFF